MAHVINADNGIVSGTPGLKYSADSTSILQFQNGGVNSLQVDASQYVSATVNGLGKGIMPAEQFYRLNTAVVGTTATIGQNIFGVGVTLVGSTQYQFEALYLLSKAAGATPHTISLGFTGTSVVTNIAYFNDLKESITSFSVITTSTDHIAAVIQTSTYAVMTPSIASAAYYFVDYIKGTVSVASTGTFFPQYTLSANPGGAYTTAIGSYFKISPLASSGTNVSIGTWA
jgi:hypothetical protein